MDPSAHYRYIRSIGRKATLHAVTFVGIDEFLETDDAREPGIVVLIHGERGSERGRVNGGPVVGEVLRGFRGLPDKVKESARPLAVVTLDHGGARGRGLDPELGEHIARRLMARMIEARSTGEVHPPNVMAYASGAPEDLGEHEGLVDEVADAVGHVLGVEPFARLRTVH